MLDDNSHYVGNELEIFAQAKNWKSYFFSHISSYLKGRVLEVGAGMGANTTEFASRVSVESWVSLEPDTDLAKTLATKTSHLPQVKSVHGNLHKMPAADSAFDAILYLDVLEHIEDDEGELRRAVQLLKGGGSLIILSPAFSYLYSPFDKALGHFRRYSRKTLSAVIPKSELECQSLIYLDALGATLSLANKMLLKSSSPSLQQILFWDRRVIPVSKILDPIFHHSFGRSVLGIWKRKA